MKLHGVDKTIQIQSSNIELGDSLTIYAREKIEDLAAKLFGRITSCEVHFRKEGAMVACSVRMKVGALRPWAAEMSHHNPYRAFNNALSKVATQMRRAKTEIREDHGKRFDKALGIQRPVRPRVAGTLIAPNLDMKPEADDYTKAQTQAANQDRNSIEAAAEILTLRDRPMRRDMPEAAE